MNISTNFNCIAEICHKPLGEKGEDSLAYNFQRPTIHAQAVFDGCGGAGGWKYPEYHQASGAFVAAQTMAKEFLSWFEQVSDASYDSLPTLADSFHDVAEMRLLQIKASCEPMGVSGSLVKSFPCTASIALMQQRETSKITLTTLNVGDSRVYFLTPQYGLVQITKDDSRGNPDPMESLRDSAPLSNLLNADKPFHVNNRCLNISLPCAVICATDGMFGFFRSPMDFEYLLLNALMNTSSIYDFECKFKAAVVAVTGDDSTCIMSFYGWKNFEDILKSMNNRYLYISGIINILDNAGTDMQHVLEVAFEQWAIYKQSTYIANTKQG